MSNEYFPDPGHKVNVWIIEDNEFYRSNLALLLNSIDWIYCSHTFSSCEDALTQLKDSFSPEILLMDIGLPGMSGIEGIKIFKQMCPEIDIIMITVYDDDKNIFNALCAGASGYLLKSSSDEKIMDGITEVLNGGASMNAQIAKKALDIFINNNFPKSDYGLTNRERDILGLIVEGLQKKKIAEKLNISYHTVDTHIKNIYSKLHVQSSSGAVAKALKERLL